jgi:hypothetical protein
MAIQAFYKAGRASRPSIRGNFTDSRVTQTLVIWGIMLLGIAMNLYYLPHFRTQIFHHGAHRETAKYGAEFCVICLWGIASAPYNDPPPLLQLTDSQYGIYFGTIITIIFNAILNVIFLEECSVFQKWDSRCRHSDSSFLLPFRNSSLAGTAIQSGTPHQKQ